MLCILTTSGAVGVNGCRNLQFRSGR
jgi:hypothetical protein